MKTNNRNTQTHIHEKSEKNETLCGLIFKMVEGGFLQNKEMTNLCIRVTHT